MRGATGQIKALTAHITLLYDDVTAAPRNVEAVRWKVGELMLLHSHIGQARPYNILGRWQV